MVRLNGALCVCLVHKLDGCLLSLVGILDEDISVILAAVCVVLNASILLLAFVRHGTID
jgi:hypothetical protein